MTVLLIKKNMQGNQAEKLKKLIRESAILNDHEKKEWLILLGVMNSKQAMELEKILTAAGRPIIKPHAPNSPLPAKGNLGHIVNIPPHLAPSHPKLASPHLILPAQGKSAVRPSVPAKTPASVAPKQPVNEKLGKFQQKLKTILSEPELSTSKKEFPLKLEAPHEHPAPKQPKPAPEKSVKPTKEPPHEINLNLSIDLGAQKLEIPARAPLLTRVKPEADSGHPPLGRTPAAAQQNATPSSLQEFVITTKPQGGSEAASPTQTGLTQAAPKPIFTDAEKQLFRERAMPKPESGNDPALLTKPLGVVANSPGAVLAKVLATQKQTVASPEPAPIEQPAAPVAVEKPVPKVQRPPERPHHKGAPISLLSLEEINKLTVATFTKSDFDQLAHSLKNLVDRFGQHAVMHHVEQSPLYKAYLLTGSMLLQKSETFESFAKKNGASLGQFLTRESFEDMADVLRMIQAA